MRHLTPTKMALKKDITSEDMEKLELSHIACENIK